MTLKEEEYYESVNQIPRFLSKIEDRLMGQQHEMTEMKKTIEESMETLSKAVVVIAKTLSGVKSVETSLLAGMLDLDPKALEALMTPNMENIRVTKMSREDAEMVAKMMEKAAGKPES